MVHGANNIKSKFILNIKDMSTQDTGFYGCNARNLRGMAVSTGFLNVIVLIPSLGMGDDQICVSYVS